MTRFIIISFLFLGFAFYEMSGGSDFDAEETRLSRVDVPAEVQEAPRATEVADASVAAPLPENVTRVSLDLNSIEDVLRPTSNLRTQPAVIRDTPTQADETDVVDAPQVLLPSLLVDRPVITPVDFGSDAAVVVTGLGQTERRRVTGSSVNVRGGPGTSYSVVNRLVRGDEVEILQDPGDGWVKLRPVSGGPEGWMADFLLSEG